MKNAREMSYQNNRASGPKISQMGGSMKRRNSRPKRAHLLLDSTTLSEKSESNKNEVDLDRFLLERDGSIESIEEKDGAGVSSAAPAYN